jgi:small acid-soluble spore protein I (minor)
MKRDGLVHIIRGQTSNETGDCAMNLNLRQAIVKRVEDKSSEELRDVIEGSIGGDDRALPGLGVLFEIIWQNTDHSVQQDLVETLKVHLQD